jgi:hypothetical protein
MSRKIWHQTRLTNYSPEDRPDRTNIPATGDPQIERQYGDKFTRFSFQNIKGTSIDSGFEIATDIDTMLTLGTDTQGLSETNKPWTPTNRWKYDFMMDAVFNKAKTIYSSTPSDHQCKYQHGGNLLSITGDCISRTTQIGNNKLGRFSWAPMRGKCNEGILKISAYRVCQDTNSRAGAFAVYQQQYTLLREAGHARPNPRQQILTDIQALIDSKRNHARC